MAEFSQVISKSRIENNPHLNLHRTGDLSNGRFLPVLTKLEVAVLTDYGPQKHHKWSSQVKGPFFIIEYQTYHVDVNISAPDKMLLKGGFLSRHNCIPDGTSEQSQKQNMISHNTIIFLLLKKKRATFCVKYF